MSAGVQAGSSAGKTAIVTGATSGVGQYTALGLARAGARTIIAGRSPDRLAATTAWLKAEVPNAIVETEQADYASLDAVRRMGERLRDRLTAIDLLVNNAGLITTRRTETADGNETIFQVNHLAPFLLTSLLLPVVRATPGARIVNVGSMASRYGRIDFDDLNLKRGWGPMKAYSRSKLGNSMFTIGLSRRLEGSGITANCVHPGFVASGLGNQGPVSGFIWMFLRPFAISPAKGAENPLFASLSPDLAGRSGLFLVDRKPAAGNKQCDEPGVIDRLWSVSETMTGVVA